MELSGHTVLVTGGASGIGLALASRFLAAGSDVVVCGRREQALRDAAARHPGLRTHVCDLARESERERLAEWAAGELPSLDVLVNNAGVQRRTRVVEAEAWEDTRQEIAINLDAPIHLTLRLLPHLMARPAAAVMNVTSGLAFAPMAMAPVYCATKAALRSWTLSLRQQLAGTRVRVVEIIPPAVNTDLGGPGLHTFGANLDEFADSIMAQIAAGRDEAAFGTAEERRAAWEAAFGEGYRRMHAR